MLEFSLFASWVAKLFGSHCGQRSQGEAAFVDAVVPQGVTSFTFASGRGSGGSDGVVSCRTGSGVAASQVGKSSGVTGIDDGPTLRPSRGVDCDASATELFAAELGMSGATDTSLEYIGTSAPPGVVAPARSADWGTIQLLNEPSNKAVP